MITTPEGSLAGRGRGSRADDVRHVGILAGDQLQAELLVDKVNKNRGEPHLLGTLEKRRQALDLSRCQVALVSLGERPEQTDLQAIEHLCGRGVVVVACGKGAHAWRVGQKCLPFLAGAVELLDLSAQDFDARLAVRLQQIFESIASAKAEKQRLREMMAGVGVVGESPAMLAIMRTVLRVSEFSDVPVLLTGETGTGKGLLARAIHRLDPKRSQHSFVGLNCGAVNAGVAESELFGHRRGSFTGAERDRKGVFRAANGGVLFLDEIGDMDQALQVKLLRVLQEGRVLGVGEDVEAAVSVRVIAATNRDLPRMLAENAFRADLFHRLNVLQIHVPPLRERPEDVGPLIVHFLHKHQSLCSEGAVTAQADFVEALTKTQLAGNVRQLEHIVCQALFNKTTPGPLALGDLSTEIWRQLSQEADEEPGTDLPISEDCPSGAEASVPPFLSDWRLSEFLRRCERLLLEKALYETRGSQAKTARLLGITPRSVYNKVRKHRLAVR